MRDNLELKFAVWTLETSFFFFFLISDFGDFMYWVNHYLLLNDSNSNFSCEKKAS